MTNWAPSQKRVLASFLFMLVSASVASALILPGVLRKAQHVSQPNLPFCTLLAEDAFSFTEPASCGINCFNFENDSPAHKGASGFACTTAGTGGFPICPTFLPNGGPDGFGSIFLDSGDPFTHVGLRMGDRFWQNYAIANEVSVSFHFKARFPGGLYGLVSTPVVAKPGEIWIGTDNSVLGDHGDRICINVDGVVDDGGPTGIAAQYCGSNAEAVNNGLGTTTGAASTPTDVWIRVAGIWDNGSYLFYVNDVLIDTVETGITGTINNTANGWELGIGTNPLAVMVYEVTNLQLFDFALNAAQVAMLNCNVPD